MLCYLSVLETEDERLCFQQIYEKNYLKMYHVAYGILKCQERAEDAVHSAFLKLAEKFSEYGHLECSKMESLCVIIVKHKAIDQIREQNRHPFVTSQETQTQMAPREEQPEEQVISGEKEEHLRQCLEILPENQRIVLVLQYYHGYSAEEIAELLDLTKKNVEIRLYRAKKRLREVYMDECRK